MLDWVITLEILEQVLVITGGMGGVINMIPDIAGGLGAALDFANIVANVFAENRHQSKQSMTTINLPWRIRRTVGELPSLESVGTSVAESGDARNEMMTTPGLLHQLMLFQVKNNQTLILMQETLMMMVLINL